MLNQEIRDAKLEVARKLIDTHREYNEACDELLYLERIVQKNDNDLENMRESHAEDEYFYEAQGKYTLHLKEKYKTLLTKVNVDEPTEYDAEDVINQFRKLLS